MHGFQWGRDWKVEKMCYFENFLKLRFAILRFDCTYVENEQKCEFTLLCVLQVFQGVRLCTWSYC